MCVCVCAYGETEKLLFFLFLFCNVLPKTENYSLDTGPISNTYISFDFIDFKNVNTLNDKVADMSVNVVMFLSSVLVGVENTQCTMYL